MSAGGRDFEVTPALLDIKLEEQKLSGRKFTPSVIEPSFGIGRIIYCMFEHAYYNREGSEEKTVFRCSLLSFLEPRITPRQQAVKTGPTGHSMWKVPHLLRRAWLRKGLAELGTRESPVAVSGEQTRSLNTICCRGSSSQIVALGCAGSVLCTSACANKCRA